MIRVCYAVDAGYAGGAERYVALLARGLDARRFTPSILLRSRADASLEAWAVELGEAGVEVHRASMRLPFRPWDACGILAAFERAAPDVVHVNLPGPYTGQTGLLAPLARMAGARVVTTEHLPMVPPLWKRALVKRAACRFVDRAITVSQANLPFLVAQGVAEARTRVIYNGVRAAGEPLPGQRRARREALGIADGDVVIAFVGSLSERKGLCDALEALSRVRDPGWRLLVIGSGPDAARARDVVARHDLGNRVRFLGQVAAGEARRLLGASDVLCLPSYMEGMPYTILEAMAEGIPVVTTRIYGVPEAVTDGVSGRLVEPGDIDGLSGALAALIADGGLRARMGDAARAAFRARFTLDRHLRATEAVYREVLGLRDGAPG